MPVRTFSCLATSLADEPETSIHVFENKAQAESINTRQNSAWKGLAAISAKLQNIYSKGTNQGYQMRKMKNIYSKGTNQGYQMRKMKAVHSWLTISIYTAYKALNINLSAILLPGWCSDVVCNTTNRNRLTTSIFRFLPFSQQIYKEVSAVLTVEQLNTLNNIRLLKQ